MATNDTTLPTTEEEWRVRLSPDEFRVLRQAGTEAPWSGEYVSTKTEGMYECRACGAALYPSDYKFDSHCGWPSFDDAIPGAVKEIDDYSHGGHVFRGEQMPAKNTRHCVNSLSIKLDPKSA